ncbi:glycosyltransferase family 1 protein [Apibacter raozihei]|uniref:glycosyltransferase family 4 protein n=1 Tax=Apibacter raozihei TaxID=2500547 RepID=UPI000FE3D979|nr:glycosyltransferase family 1 protein [Apibacter raozihei]
MKKTNKILVDAHVFDNSFQGTTSYLMGLYNSLVGFDDIEITLCSHDVNRLQNFFPHKNFKYIQLQSKSKIKRLLFELPKIIRDNKFDYAHFQYIVPPIKKCKYINTIHDVLFLDFKNYFPWSYRLVKGILFRYSAKKTDIILTVSEYSKKAIAKNFKIDSNKIFITPNAVRLSKEIKSNISMKDKYNLRNYIHYVSRFEPRKNQIGLLEVYLNLNLYKEYDLVFIGRKKDKVEKQTYEMLVKKIPPTIANRIFFFDDLSEQEMNYFYQESSCFVYPSFAEGFGIPPLEAGVNNCKVLSSNQTAMSDFNFFKYTFNPNNFEEFKEKLKEVLDDKNYPYKFIHDKIVENYNWDKISNNLYNYLTTCL